MLQTDSCNAGGVTSEQEAVAYADTALKQLAVFLKQQTRVKSTLDSDAAKTKLRQQYDDLKVATTACFVKLLLLKPAVSACIVLLHSPSNHLMYVSAHISRATASWAYLVKSKAW